MSLHGKRYRQASESLSQGEFYAIDDALKLVKQSASAKFDETVDVSINLGVDAKKSDQSVRGATVLPKGTGKTVCVAVFADGDDVDAAKSAGADIVVAHMGLTTKGTIGATTAMTLEQSPAYVQAICDAARGVNLEVIVLCHGGPISEPEDAEYVLQNTTGVNGFYGASSMERLPVEVAITEHMRKFKEIRF